MFLHRKQLHDRAQNPLICMYRLNNIKMPLKAGDKQIAKKIAEVCDVEQNLITNVHIAKKSVDARNKSHVHFVYSMDFNCSQQLCNIENLEQVELPKLPEFKIKNTGIRPIVVGSGPAGMFAGIALSLAGLRPIILERGKDVDSRQKDVETFWKLGQLNPESNVQFGEGGAGTFSDGKLMSGIKKDRFTYMVMKELYDAGAPAEILFSAKPHIGTDNLRTVVRNIRRKITDLGGEYRFNSKLKNLIVKNDVLQAISVEGPQGEYDLPADRLFLAVGHSARDTFEMLLRCGVFMEQKAFSVGARIEHLQKDLNVSQYGKEANNPLLPAADYKLAVHLPNGRSVYTFCMCPGGQVVAAASETGRLVTNGMSEFARNKKNANSALLVGVDANDFGSKEPLAGMYFQRKLEERAFVLGGKNYHAPAQLVGDFLQNKESSKAKNITPSYQPKVNWCNLSSLYPEDIADSLRCGITQMANKLKVFADKSAVLTGVETRSSSPVRILRDSSMQSNIKGIFPCGEGAGYAGGITSAATDGLKAVYSLSEEA